MSINPLLSNEKTVNLLNTNYNKDMKGRVLVAVKYIIIECIMIDLSGRVLFVWKKGVDKECIK